MTIFQLFLSGVANWRTTIAGAALGTLNQIALVGIKMPTNKTEALATGMTVAYIFLGILAKDSATGSQPANVVAPDPAPAKKGAAVDANLTPIPGTSNK